MAQLYASNLNTNYHNQNWWTFKCFVVGFPFRVVSVNLLIDLVTPFYSFLLEDEPEA
jgi:hypothetical protein